MLKTYLSKKIHTICIFSIFFAWLLGTHFFLFFIAFSYTCLLFLFRQHSIPLQNNNAIKQNTVYSPVNGHIISIKKNVDHAFFGKNLHEIRMSIPWWKEFGITLPFASGVKDLIMNKGRSFYRFYRKELPSQEIQTIPSLIILLGDSQSNILGIQLIKCPLGMWPKVKILPGDRAECLANIGYFPFGGSLLLYLPSEYEILISENDEVMARNTAIGIKAL